MPSPTEIAAVRAVLEAYMDANWTGDADALRAVFHPHAVVCSVADDQAVVAPAGPTLDSVDPIVAPSRVGEDYRAEIVSIHLTGKAASAVMVEDHLLGHNYINHFQLLFAGGGWRIVARTFVTVAGGPPAG